MDRAVMNYNYWPTLLKETYVEWSEDDCLQIGAALSFYTLSSLVPLLLVLGSVATYLAVVTPAGQDMVSQIIDYIGRNVGPQTAESIAQAVSKSKEGLAYQSVVGAVVGFFSLLITASGVFGQLDSAFDTIWAIPDEAKPRGLLGIIRAKLFSFGLVLGVAFILLISTVLTPLINNLTATLAVHLPAGNVWVPLVNLLVQLAITSGVFALLFKYLPNTTVAWPDVGLGGALTAVLWMAGQMALSIYFRTASFSSYGVVGGVLTFLVYIYYSSQIVFFGGEFTKVYSKARAAVPPDGMTACAPSPNRSASTPDRLQPAAVIADEMPSAPRILLGGLLGLISAGHAPAQPHPAPPHPADDRPTAPARYPAAERGVALPIALGATLAAGLYAARRFMSWQAGPDRKRQDHAAQ